MKVVLVIAAVSLRLVGEVEAAQTLPPRIENCGWLIENGSTLTSQSDLALKPRDPGSIPSPPPHTKAVYCDREAITTDDGDERITEMGLPLVIRQGDRVGVIEYPPKVVFNYHWADGKFLPGSEPNQP